MSTEQKKTCVFANKYKENNCSALKEYYCENEMCNFYKSNEEYTLDGQMFCEKKGFE